MPIPEACGLSDQGADFKAEAGEEGPEGMGPAGPSPAGEDA